MCTEQPVQGDADIAQIGALIGDPARARVLTALTDGRALHASRLAAEAGVAPSTVSEHLARLLAAGRYGAARGPVPVLPARVSRGRRRPGGHLADLPAAADPLAAPGQLRPGPAGGPDLLQPPGRRLGVGLLAGLLDGGLLSGGDGGITRNGPWRTGCPPPAATCLTGSPRAARPYSGRSAWTSTRRWPASLPCGTASTGLRVSTA